MSKIGLLSDSHGRATTTRRAVQVLLEQQVQRIVHLGDIGTVEVIDALVEDLDEAGRVRPPVHVVFGNTDWDGPALGRYAEGFGIQVDHPVGRLTVDDRVVVYQHGHQSASMQQALAEEVDYLCHGHTHRTRDERRGRTRLINPGALFRASRYTVAVLDAGQDELKFIEVAAAGPAA